MKWHFYRPPNISILEWMVMFLLGILVCASISHAAEVCTDRDEFIHFAQRYQLLEKRDKTQSESIKALMEKDKAWQQYKASAEPLLAEYASRLEESIKREEALTARNEYLEARDAEQKKMEWIEKAEVAGTAVAVALTARWGGVKVLKWLRGWK